MADEIEIKFDNTDTYQSFREASPLWSVACDDTVPVYGTREEAEEAAARAAVSNPGEKFFVMAAVSQFVTSPKVNGTRFNPDKRPTPPAMPEPEPQYPEVEEPAPLRPVHSDDAPNPPVEF